MNPFAIALGEVAPPDWQGAARRHRIETKRDQIPVDRRGFDRPVPEVDEADPAAVAKAKNGSAEHRKQWREKDAAARGEVFLPLEPGQKRRRRATADGTPLVRGQGGQRGGGYIRPERAPGEMTYGEAVRVVHRWKDGDAVELEDLAKAQRTIDATRAAGAGA